MRTWAFYVISFLALVCFLSGSACSQGDTQADSQKPVPPPLEYVGSWGVKGDGPGQLQGPASLATDSIGNIYIADAVSRFVHKFDPQGKPLLSFQEDPLKHPQSITVDRGGAIYVTDPGRHSVFIFLPNGDRYRELRLRTRPSAGNFLSVAVGDDGLIHVLDADAGKIFTYTPRLRLVQSWAPPRNSLGTKSNDGPVAIGPDGYLYVADASGDRILRFTREGHLLSEIGPGADGTEQKLSDRFAVSNSYVFVMDTDGRMLHVWTVDGKPKLDIDLAPQLGQGSRPAPALAVSPRGELLVLDTPEARVLRYRINF